MQKGIYIKLKRLVSGINETVVTFIMASLEMSVYNCCHLGHKTGMKEAYIRSGPCICML